MRISSKIPHEPFQFRNSMNMSMTGKAALASGSADSFGIQGIRKTMIRMLQQFIRCAEEEDFLSRLIGVLGFLHPFRNQAFPCGRHSETLKTQNRLILIQRFLKNIDDSV